MKAFVLLTASGLAMASGCQVSGERDVDTNRRPSARVEVSGYSIGYEATRDTEWAASTAAAAERGTLRRGDRVMFSDTPNTSTEWQQARLPDGVVRWVRPADFRMVSTR